MTSDILVRMRRSEKCGKTYEYRFETASVDGKRKWSSKGGFKTAKAARLAGLAALNEYNNCGRVVQATEMSFADFLDYWMEHDCKAVLKESTFINYQKKIKNHIKPELGGYRMKLIDKDRLQEFLNAMHDNGYARNTLMVDKGILTKCFMYAVDRRYLPSSPAVGIKLPKYENTSVPTRTAPHVYIAHADMARILERFSEGTSSFIPLMLGYHCGLRIAEAYALTWDDIDLDNAALTVRRQIQWRQYKRSAEVKRAANGRRQTNAAGEWYFTKPKYDSCRCIDLDSALVELLQREKERQNKAREENERYCRYYEDERKAINENGKGIEVFFVCVREDGSYINSRTMQHTSKVIHTELDMPEFDYHSLRHTHTTELIENGAPLKYVQKRLGHKNINVTLNIYQHMTEGMKQQGREVIERMLRR